MESTWKTEVMSPVNYSIGEMNTTRTWKRLASNKKQSSQEREPSQETTNLLIVSADSTGSKTR